MECGIVRDDDSLWILRPESIAEIDCVRTCQGLELDCEQTNIGMEKRMVLSWRRLRAAGVPISFSRVVSMALRATLKKPVIDALIQVHQNRLPVKADLTSKPTSLRAVAWTR